MRNRWKRSAFITLITAVAAYWVVGSYLTIRRKPTTTPAVSYERNSGGATHTSQATRQSDDGNGEDERPLSDREPPDCTGIPKPAHAFAPFYHRNPPTLCYGGHCAYVLYDVAIPRALRIPCTVPSARNDTYVVYDLLPGGEKKAFFVTLCPNQREWYDVVSHGPNERYPDALFQMNEEGCLCDPGDNHCEYVDADALRAQVAEHPIPPPPEDWRQQLGLSPL